MGVGVGGTNVVALPRLRVIAVDSGVGDSFCLLEELEQAPPANITNSTATDHNPGLRHDDNRMEARDTRLTLWKL